MVRAALRVVAAGVIAAGLPGCVVRDPPPPADLFRDSLPQTQLPENWTASPTPAGPVGDGWLARFHDAQLEKLVAEAMLYNTDLKVAAARVEAAEASARAAGALIWPQVNVSGRGGGKLSGDSSGIQGIGLFASWELDLWGRVRATRAVGSAQYESAALDARYARESIAAMVAKTWFLARQATAQRAIAAEMAQSASRLSDLARDRLSVGKSDEYEVAQADSSVLGYRDLVLQADLARQGALRSLELLVGRYPSASIEPGMALPPPPDPVPAGLPSELIERRPDVRAAERRIAAAFYNVHAAQAARLPRIALTAGVSTVSSDLFFMKERDNPVWNLGGTILAPIFAGGALEAQAQIRTAEQKAAVADYGRIGARAFSEVESALSGAINLDARSAILSSAVTANERALGFANVRYDVGSGDLRGVQQQLLVLHASRTTLVQVQAERLIQRVNLYLALGGGFEPTPQAPAPQ